ncbi:MAG: RecX family transcriptional regulator [Clostridia bacterium]
MPVVTGIYRTGGIVKVAADGRTLCAIDLKTFQQFPLEEGDALDTEAYLDRISRAQFSGAYECALSMLDRSAKTQMQVLQTLVRKGFVPAAAEAAIERLNENHLLDDQALAERMVELAQGRPVGRYALKRKLRAKGVSEEDADAALASMTREDQQDGALMAARKLMSRYEGLEIRAARQKLSQALARRGFGWDVIGPAVEAMFLNEDAMDS